MVSIKLISRFNYVISRVFFVMHSLDSNHLCEYTVLEEAVCVISEKVDGFQLNGELPS